MVYSDSHKFVYLCTPKTASTTLLDVFTNQYGAKVYKGDDTRDRHDNRVPERFAGYFTFATVRHPYTRAISGYAYVSQGRDMPLDEAFRHFHLISQADYIHNHDLAITAKVPKTAKWGDYLAPKTPRRIDAVLHTERLLWDLNALPFVSRPFVSLPVYNRGKPEWRNPKMDDAVWDYLLRHHLDDFHLFGYDVERDVEPLLL